MAGRLLFDENLSHRLVSVTADAFPGSIHIRDAGLKGATDQEIWPLLNSVGTPSSPRMTIFVA
jgi:predicted nuclease of predicted toxin-antitoxin system